MAVVSPSVPEGLTLPPDVRVVGVDQLSAGKRSWIHEEAAGRKWRISAQSFFQSGPDAAELLAATVGSVVGDAIVSSETRVLDLYSGVGLFAGTLGADGRGTWTTVELSPSALADARINLADIAVRHIESRVERYHPGRTDIVIADPPRSGLGERGVKVIAASKAETVCLVSCDLGAFGRDIKLLTDRGYTWTDSVVLDLFPKTSHVEVVTRLDRHTVR